MGEPALKETDTFDTFMESSWYYARYPHQAMLKVCWIKRKQTTGYRWINISAVSSTRFMHLLYFRFFHKLLRDAGFVTSDEPAQNYYAKAWY